MANDDPIPLAPTLRLDRGEGRSPSLPGAVEGGRRPGEGRRAKVTQRGEVSLPRLRTSKPSFRHSHGSTFALRHSSALLHSSFFLLPSNGRGSGLRISLGFRHSDFGFPAGLLPSVGHASLGPSPLRPGKSRETTSVRIPNNESPMTNGKPTHNSTIEARTSTFASS